jgi:nicotinate-nucleotide pyrophosphorylase (carboxylating)
MATDLLHLEPLAREEYVETVRRALNEDVRDGDITTDATVPMAQGARGVFIVKNDCVLAGLDVAFESFRQLDPNVSVTALRHDGDLCSKGEQVAAVAGPARALLIGERTALNFLQRLSGIATRARRFVDASGGRITILDTRKTTPTLRVLEKYAVRAGGGTNHRAGLFDAVLIKENHIHLAGGVRQAVERCRAHNPGVPIEIEAETLPEFEEALAADVDVILLDNMSTADIRTAVARTNGRTKIEISGGVTLDRLPELAATGADFVSIGSLTHSAPAIDISFEIDPL